jgi:hypothetical protein
MMSRNDSVLKLKSIVHPTQYSLYQLYLPRKDFTDGRWTRSLFLPIPGTKHRICAQNIDVIGSFVSHSVEKGFSFAPIKLTSLDINLVAALIFDQLNCRISFIFFLDRFSATASVQNVRSIVMMLFCY